MAREVPAMTGPDDKAAAFRGHLRAAHADRDQVIAVLEAAFVQGRLTKDELEARAAQTLVSKTYAELAALTADIPARPADIPVLPAVPTGSVAPGPARTPARTLGTAARRSGVCLITAMAVLEGAFLTGDGLLIILAFLLFMAATGFMGYGIIDARQERRSRGQFPSRPDQDGRGPDDGRTGRATPDPFPPGPRTDPTRADPTRADLRARALRSRHPLWHSDTYRGTLGLRRVYWVLRCTNRTSPVTAFTARVSADTRGLSRPGSRSAGWTERSGRS
jgi:Domain of unknown function (DUF1707)